LKKNKDKSAFVYISEPDGDGSKEDEFGFIKTAEIERNTFVGEIPIEHLAYLEIMGQENNSKRIEIEGKEVTIGRTPDCDIRLLVENVSRMHARIIYRNEEYQIEDLGSKNGVYVNGVRIEKCTLRKHDLIEIGGVRILFVEEETRRDSVYE